MLKRRWKSTLLLATALATVIFVVGASDAFRSCLHDRRNAQSYAPLDDSPSALRRGIARLDLYRSCFGDFTDKNAEPITAAATLIIAAFTFTLWRATTGMLRVAEEQREDAQRAIAVAEAANELNRENSVADRRAWISIEDVKLKHPTKITEEGIIWGVSATLKNLGETPATGVWVGFHSYFSTNNSEGFSDAESHFKAQLRRNPVHLGSILFPQDVLIQGQSWMDGIANIERAIETRPSTGEKKIGFTIFIGVAYRIVGDQSVHVTYHPHGMLNVPIGMEIPEGQLIDLPRMPFIAGEAT